MKNEERWWNLLRGFLDEDLAQEMEVRVPASSLPNEEILPRYMLFTQEGIINMQLIRSIERLIKTLEAKKY